MARTQLFAFQLGLVTTFLPSFLLSGFLYAIENMPVPIQVITHVVPARYFVTIVRGIFLKGIGIDFLWGQVAVPGGILPAGVLGGGTQNEAEARLRHSAMRERIFAIIRKELQPVVPQPAHRMFLFVPPMFQLIIFGYAVNLDVDNLRMGWMDMDQSPQSHDLLASFPGIGPLPADRPAAQRKRNPDVLDRGEAQVIVRVMPGFGRDILLGRPTSAQILVDGTNSNTASLASAYTSQLVGAYSASVATPANAVAHDGPRGHGHHEPEGRAYHRQRRGYGSIPT